MRSSTCCVEVRSDSRAELVRSVGRDYHYRGQHLLHAQDVPALQVALDLRHHRAVHVSVHKNVQVPSDDRLAALAGGVGSKVVAGSYLTDSTQANVSILCRLIPPRADKQDLRPYFFLWVRYTDRFWPAMLIADWLRARGGRAADWPHHVQACQGKDRRSHGSSTRPFHLVSGLKHCALHRDHADHSRLAVETQLPATLSCVTHLKSSRPTADR